MRLADILRSGTELLKNAGVDEFELDARLLLEHVLNKSRTELYLAIDLTLTDEQLYRYNLLLGRREKREPVAYILGEQEFWSLPFIVTPDVLIPRPETEFLLEQVLSLAKESNFNKGKIIDLCCGSGIIATVLARELGQKIYGVDISSQALVIARKNIERHGVTRNVQLVQSNLFDVFNHQEQFSLIVSNPPYVSHIDVINNLAPEVCDYEPHLALDGGVKGIEIIATIREQLEYLLLPGGELFMEIGADQGAEVSSLFNSQSYDSHGFSTVEILKDYAGRDRVIHAIKSER